ncbi:MAG: hypothetical protein CML73_05150 [Rhodobiaceae bacterium]|nr:hypothetical protein [Rhodobiaceae bacterium]
MPFRSAFVFSSVVALAVVILTTVSVTAVNAKEIARRAPLNIIPKPIEVVAATDRKAQMNNTSETVLPKLAPGGLSLKRPIRNVAALPGGKGLVQVGTLSVLEETDIGLRSAITSGLWLTSRMSEVSRHFSRMPTQLALPSAYSLAQDLLLNRASPPPGVSEGVNFFAMRLNNLLRFGDTESVLELVALTGADNRDADVIISATEARLAQNNTAAACDGLKSFNRLNLNAEQGHYALKLRGYCQLVDDNLLAASLTLDLAYETGVKDTLFSDILFSSTASVEYERQDTALTGPISSLIAALMLHAKAEIYIEDIPFLPLAMTDEFLKADYLMPDLKLRMAEFRMNRVFANEDVYRNLVNNINEYTAPQLLEGPVYDTSKSDDLERETSDENSDTGQQDYLLRARALQTLNQPLPENEPYETLHALLDMSADVTVWPGIIETVAPALTASRPDVNNIIYADKIIPALLWLDEIAAAQVWQTALVERQNGFPTALTRRMQGLIRVARSNDGHEDNPEKSQTASLISDISITDAVIGDEISVNRFAIRDLPPTETMLLGAVLETGTDAEKAYALSEIALLPVLSYDVPLFLSETLPLIDDVRLGQMLDLMQDALENERQGEVILHGLAAISHQSQTEFNMLAMQQILLGLKEIGLHDHARRIALEVLILQAVSLPQS